MRLPSEREVIHEERWSGLHLANAPTNQNSSNKWASDPLGKTSWKSRLERRRRQHIMPWIGSILGHALLLGLILLIGLNLIREDRAPKPPVITAEIGQTTSAPLLELDVVEEPARPQELPPLEIPKMTPSIGESLLAPGESSGFSGLGSGLSGGRRGTMGSVMFAGLKGNDAKRIAFVVDASGSMIATFPVITKELERSIKNLSEVQFYSVVFFQKDQAVSSPPKDRMVPATEGNLGRTMNWINEAVVPSGRSNPVLALEEAMGLEPEIIYLLSSNVTGSGQYAVDLEVLIEQLDRLNPKDPSTGQRAVRIKCIQFLDPDPSEALKKIAEIHSGEADEENSGYRFLGRSELGLAPNRR